jgi:hypothetical protein
MMRGDIRNTFEMTAERSAACERGGAWPSSSRTQGEALGGAKREPEDAEMRRCHAPHLGVRGRALRRPVPDAPVTSADFTFFGAAKGLLQNSTNLCRGTHRATVRLKGHNGKVSNYQAPLKPTGCKKHAKHRRHARRGAKR